MKKYLISPINTILFLIIISCMIISCKKDDEIGLDIIDLPGDRFGFGYCDTSTVIAYSVMDDSILTSNVFLNLLGSYYDPVFGRVTSGIYTQALLSTNNVSFGNNAVGDSIVLTLQYNGYYGDSTSSLRLKVYEIDPNADFSKDSAYYSNQNILLGDLLFDNVVDFNPLDSVLFEGNMIPPALKVTLDQKLTQKFIDASGSADLMNNDAFRQFFKGLHITVEPVSSPGDGIIGYFNLNSDLSKLTLYYHNDIDTLSYPFVINADCAKFTNFNHYGYTDADHDLQNQDTNGINSRLFLQSMAGMKIKVKLPHISDLYSNGPVGINKAELVIRVDKSDHTASKFPHPPKLTIARINDEGRYFFTTDFLFGETFLGGFYDPIKHEYRFRVTRHLHDILSGKYENHGLVVLVAAAAVRGERVVVKGNDLSEKNLTLEIVYTKP